jgi:hypothetical protein
MHRLIPLFALAFTFVFGGCASWGPNVQSAGPQMFSITAEDRLNWNTTTTPAREVAFESANKYCAKRKLVMVPVSLDVRPGEIGVRPGTADLVFRALKPSDPAIARSQAVFRHYDPMVVRESVVKYGSEESGTESVKKAP